MNKTVERNSGIKRVLIVGKDTGVRRKSEDYEGIDKRSLDYSYTDTQELNADGKLSDLFGSNCEVVFAYTREMLHLILTNPSQGDFDAILYIGHIQEGKQIPQESPLNSGEAVFATANTQSYIGSLYKEYIDGKAPGLQKIFSAKVLAFLDIGKYLPQELVSHPHIIYELLTSTLSFEEVSGIIKNKVLTRLGIQV